MTILSGVVRGNLSPLSPEGTPRVAAPCPGSIRGWNPAPDHGPAALSWLYRTLTTQQAGARGYIMKQEAMQNLIAAIRCVASGKTYVSARMSERIVTRVMGRRTAAEPPAPLERLTDREREVFALIGRGLGTRDIAGQLSLSIKTIETHQARIKEKLSLTNSRELIRAAMSWTQA